MRDGYIIEPNADVKPEDAVDAGGVGPVAPCDVDAFVERVGGDVELAREMAELFVPDALRLLGAIGVAIAAGDAEQLRLDAHALKGSAGNFDAAPTVAGALALEQMGKSGDIARASGIYSTLQTDVADLIAALRVFAETRPCVS